MLAALGSTAFGAGCSGLGEEETTPTPTATSTRPPTDTPPAPGSAGCSAPDGVECKEHPGVYVGYTPVNRGNRTKVSYQDIPFSDHDFLGHKFGPLTYSDVRASHTRSSEFDKDDDGFDGGDGDFYLEIEDWQYQDKDTDKPQTEEVYYVVAPLSPNYVFKTPSDDYWQMRAPANEDEDWNNIFIEGDAWNDLPDPLLFHSRRRKKDDKPVITRTQEYQNSTYNSYQVRMQHEKGVSENHARHYTDTFAIEQTDEAPSKVFVPSLGLDGAYVAYEAGSNNQAWGTDDGWYQIDFEGNYINPVFLADVYSNQVPDPVNLRYRNLFRDGVEVGLETPGLYSHGDEYFNWLVIDKPQMDEAERFVRHKYGRAEDSNFDDVEYWADHRWGVSLLGHDDENANYGIGVMALQHQARTYEDKYDDTQIEGMAIQDEVMVTGELKSSTDERLDLAGTYLTYYGTDDHEPTDPRGMLLMSRDEVGDWYDNEEGNVYTLGELKAGLESNFEAAFDQDQPRWYDAATFLLGIGASNLDKANPVTKLSGALGVFDKVIGTYQLIEEFRDANTDDCDSFDLNIPDYIEDRWCLCSGKALSMYSMVLNVGIDSRHEDPVWLDIDQMMGIDPEAVEDWEKTGAYTNCEWRIEFYPDGSRPVLKYGDPYENWTYDCDG